MAVAGSKHQLMMPNRAKEQPLRARVTLRAAALLFLLAVGWSGCGGGSKSDMGGPSACLSCAMKACPSQAAACDASPGCKALRACSLACRSGDAACQNACTTAVANDSTAILAGANYLACAQTACPNECSGSSATGTAGTSGGPGGSSGSAGQGGSTGTAGTGGTSGGICATATAKLTSCGAAWTGTCDATSLLDQCDSRCIIDNSCSAIVSTTGVFSDCLDICDVTAGEGNVFKVAAGGYVTAGAWKGYAWTATDGVSATTINPTSFSTLAEDGKLCVSGVVAGTSDYSAVAILGISINQAQGSPAPRPSTWPPTGGGISYGLTNPGGSPLRIQIQAAGGATDPTKRWCKPTNGNVETPFWIDFNTKCWDWSGLYYDGRTPLESVMVLVPGDLVATPFNFCVVALTPHP
jgi:hypothetical protein